MNKAILCCVIMLGLGLIASAPTPTPFDASKVDYSKFSEADIAATEAHKNQLKGQVKDSLNTIVTTSDEQGKTLQSAKKALEDYIKANEEQINRGNQAIVSLAALVKKHHLDLIILIGLWIGLVGLLYLKAGTMLGAAGIYIAAGLALGGTVFIMLRL